MKCPKCNKEIEESGYYCPYCGEKIDRDLIKESYTMNRKYYKMAGSVIVIIFLLCVLPVNSIGNNIKAEVQVRMGDKYLEDLDYEQALACYNQAIQIDPMNISAYKGAVNSMLGMGNDGSAIQLLSQGVQITENYEMKVWLSELQKEREYLSTVTEEFADEKEDMIQNVIKEEIDDTEIIEGNLEIIKDKNPGMENEKIKWLFSLKINENARIDYTSNFHIEMCKIKEMEGDEPIFEIVDERNYTSYKLYKDIYRFIDTNGNMVTNIMVYDFSEYGIGDNGWILYNNKFVDLEGKIRLMIPEGYRIQGTFHNGLCRLTEAGTNEWCFMDEKGNILPERYYSATDFRDGIAFVGIKKYDGIENDNYYTQKNADGTETKFHVKYTYIKPDGSMLMETPYEVTEQSKEGLICIKDTENGKWGYADTAGKIVIPCIYEYASNAENGVLRVRDEERGELLLNITGSSFYDDERYYFDGDWSEKPYLGLIKIIDRNAEYDADRGVVNLNGIMVVPCEYSQVTVLDNGIIKCLKKQHNSDYSIASEITDYYNMLGEKIEKPKNEAADCKMTGNEFSDVTSKLIVSGNGHYLSDWEGNILIGNSDGMIYLLTDDIFYYKDDDYLHVYQYVG